MLLPCGHPDWEWFDPGPFAKDSDTYQCCTCGRQYRGEEARQLLSRASNQTDATPDEAEGRLAADS